MTKDYQKPEFKTVTFEKEDVITTSGGVVTPPKPGTNQQ